MVRERSKSQVKNKVTSFMDDPEGGVQKFF
jgi:hypothetical protein